MTIKTRTRSVLALGLSATMILSTQMATVAQAEMLSTESAIARYAAEADRAHLLSEMQRADVRAEMAALGIDPAEAEARLKALSDEEVAMMLEQFDADSAGGSGLVGAAVTIFLVLLVTDLLCLTSVFSFTRCAR